MDIEALVPTYGPIGAALILLGYAVLRAWINSATDAEVPKAKTGLTDGDKLWLIEQIREPLSGQIDRIDRT